MTLRTRRAAGVVSWPMVLVEGPDFSGKTFVAAEFTESARIGDSYWIALGESAPETAGPELMIVDHNGSWYDIYGQVSEIHAVAAQSESEKPAVLVIDSMTAEWELLKDWISLRARESKHSQKLLRDDPNADIRLSNVLWDDASDRHDQLMRLLTTFNGFVVVTARCKESVALDGDGRPIPGTTDYRVDAHRTLTHDASVWLRMSRDEPPTLIGGASGRPGVDKPPRYTDLTLEQLLFDDLGYGQGTPRPRAVTPLRADEAELAAQARAAVREYTLGQELNEDEVLAAFYQSRGEALRDCRDVAAILQFLAHLKQTRNAA